MDRPGLDDTSWLLLLMFVSASLFLDYGAAAGKGSVTFTGSSSAAVVKSVFTVT